MTQGSETTIRTDAQRASSSRKLGRLSLIPTAAAAVAGWSASFIGLHGFAVRQMSGFTADTAWLVPGAFDLSAFGSTVLVYRASINGRSGFRSRVMMYLFTALSAWINWIHQGNGAARFVACVLPVAAVIVFDGLAAEYRADWEADHGRKAFRMRLGLLLLRRMVDKEGTKAAFRAQITAIPVSALVGLGADLSAGVVTAPAAAIVPEPEPEPAWSLPPEWSVSVAAAVNYADDNLPGPLRPPSELVELLKPFGVRATVSDVESLRRERTWSRRSNAGDPTLTDADLLLMSEPPAWSEMTVQAAIERADSILTGAQRTGPELVVLLGEVGIKTTDSYVRTVRRRARERAELVAEPAGELVEDDAGEINATVYQIPRQPHAGAQSA